MRLDRATRRLSSWIAALAIAFSALAPALAQAWADPDAAAWTEVCSATAATRARADAGNDAPLPGTAQLLEHCPCCWLHAPTAALPPTQWVLMALPDLATPAQAAWPKAPPGAEIWPGARPRAPPLSN